MHFTIPILALASAMAVEATWCTFYYDSACKNSASSAIDCGNPLTNGVGGRYVKCSGTSHNKETCRIGVGTMQVGPGKYIGEVPADGSTCKDLGVAGPWYTLWLKDSQGPIPASN